MNKRLLTLLMLVLAITGCGEPTAVDRPGRQGDEPVKIVATVGMVGDIAKAVAGDEANVTVIMGEGTDPHLYKPVRDDVTHMNAADVVFYNGLLLEGKMSDVLVKMSRGRPVVAVTETVDETLLLSPDKFAGHYDPHVWMEPTVWAACVDVVAETLAEYDAAKADAYRERAAAYKQDVLALDDYGKDVLSTLPDGSRVMITSHDAFNYFGRAFGLDVMGIQGLSTESEAGLQRMNELVDLIVDKKVKAVFIESSVPAKSMEALVNGAKDRGHDVVIGGTLYSDAMGSAGTYEGTYIGMIDHNITTVARALGGEAPAGGMNGKLAQ